MWHKVQRSDRVQEYFFKDAYIQSDTWKASRPPKIDRDYPYIKDRIEDELMQNGTNVTMEIRVSEITHVTKCNNMMSILEEGGFRSGVKIIPGLPLCRFVWFGMKIGEEEIASIKKQFELQALDPSINIGAAGEKSILLDKVTSQFASSPAFQPISRYGNFKFTFGIQDAIDAYRSQYCPVLSQSGLRSEPEFRKLGTFAYKQEVMHVILVCPTGTPERNSCPLLFDDLTPVIRQDMQNPCIWIWRPHATGNEGISATEYGYKSYPRRWEHVTLAFHVPEGSYFRLSNMEHHLSLCLGVDMFQRGRLLSVSGAIDETISAIKIIPSIFKRKILFNVLIRMIRGYLDDEPLYEKMGSPISDEYTSLSLGSVCDVSRDILQGEDFDWWPLIEWMKSVKQTRRNKPARQIIFEYLSTIVKACVPQMPEHYM